MKQVAFGWAAAFVIVALLSKHGAQTTVTPPAAPASTSSSRQPAAGGRNDAANEALTRLLTSDLDKVSTAFDEVDAAMKAKKWSAAKERLRYLAEIFEPLRGIKISVDGTDKKTGKSVPGVTELVEKMRDEYESYRSALSTFEYSGKAATKRAAVEAQPAQDDSDSERLARGLGFNEVSIRLATKIAARFDVPKMRAFDMAIKAGQLCLEKVPHSQDVSADEMTVAIARHALVFVEGVTRSARQRQMMPLTDAFVTYRLSGCPM